nr:MAG TPA: hypothetical protein [Bacteriophage sp.]
MCVAQKDTRYSFQGLVPAPAPFFYIQGSHSVRGGCFLYLLRPKSGRGVGFLFRWDAS